MRKFLLFVALVILTLSPGLVLAQNITPATPLQLCPDNNYVTLDPIAIIENDTAEFTAGESGVTYSLILPSGFQFEPFTGSLFVSDSFSSNSFIVYPDSALITYSLNSGSENGIDSIIVSGLRVRTSIASLASADIDRGGTATHSNNAPGANSHGSLSSGQALTGVNVTATDITCNGDGDGSLTVNIASGNAPYQYSIDFGSTYPYPSSPINGLNSGGYIVTVEDALGCVANSGNIGIINEPLALTEVSVIKTDISCNGGSDGTITASATGGTGAINYSVNGITGPFDNLSGSTFTSLGTGAIDIYFEDANGCQLDGTDRTINEPLAIVIPAPSTTAPSTSGSNDGQIIFGVVSGGTPPYNYSIDGGSSYQTSVTFNNLGPGTYNLQVRDANACVEIDGSPVIFSDPGSINAGSISINFLLDTNVCANAAISINIQSDTSAVNGSSYQWQQSFNGSTWNNIGGATSETYTVNGPQTTGRYLRRRATKAQDVAFTNVVRIIINNGNTVNVTIPDPIVCLEGNNQLISASPAPAVSQSGVFSITPGPGLTDNNNGTASLNPSLAGVNTHTITYTFTNEFGCISSNNSNIDVVQNTSVNLTIPQSNFVTTDPPVLLNGTPSGGTYSGPGLVGNQFRPNLADTGSNQLIYTQTDSEGCVGTDMINVNVAVPGGSIAGLSSPYCTNDPVSTITGVPTGIGTTPIGFLASPILSNFTPTTADLNPNVTDGTYNITYRYFDQFFSIITISATVEINQAPTATIITNGPDSICSNSSIRTLNGIPASGLTTAFSGSGITNLGSSATFDPASVGNGSYLVTYTYTDNNNCTDIADTTIKVNPSPTASIVFGQTGGYCSNDPADLLTGFPTPTPGLDTGFFSGSGLSNPSLGTTNFTPGNPTLGLNVIRYTYINQFGCSDFVDSTKFVQLVPTVTLSGLDGDYCINNENDTLTGSPSTNGNGYFRGLAAASGSVDSLSGILDVTVLTPGSAYSFEYVFTDNFGCTSTGLGETDINALPIVQIPLSEDSFCIDDSPINLNANPVPSSTDITDWTGIGIQNENNAVAQFNPQIAGSGQHPITFIFTKDNPTNNCTDSATVILTVNSLPTVSFVFADKSTLDTIIDLRFCEYQDSILLQGNQNSGTFSSANANLSNIGGGQAIFRPGQTVSTYSSGNKSIEYTYTNPITGCTNDTSISPLVNFVPNNVVINSVPSPAFNLDPPLKNLFCTEDDSVRLDRTYLAIPGANFGTGTFEIIPDPGPGPGGLFRITPDSATFKSILPSGNSYEIRYVFTDTVTTCRDTIRKLVEIQAEPFLGVQIFKDGGSMIIDSLNNPIIPICTNGDSILFRGKNGTGATDFASIGESFFEDETDANVGQLDTIVTNVDTFFVFHPNQTNLIGLHSITFDYTSNIGCQDVLTFQLDVLDTSQVDLLFDTTFLVSNISQPEVCKSLDSLFISPFSPLLGFGTVSVSPQSNPNLSPGSYTNQVSGNTNDTLFFVRPNVLAQISNPLDYKLIYNFTETVSGEGCQSVIEKNFAINPLPRLTPSSFNLPSSYCEYDDIDLIFGNGGISNFDSGFFKGPGITNISNDSAFFDPQSITPLFTDSGSTDSIVYTVNNDFGCTDSITKIITVYPTPDIEFTIQDTTSTLVNFCKSNGNAFVINERQPSGTLLGSISRVFKGGGGTNGNTFVPQFLPIGPNILQVVLTTQFGGCKDTASQQIFVYDDPIAGFSTTGFCITDPIGFIDTSSTNVDSTLPPSPIVSWDWVLAPGFTSDVQNPILDYDTSVLGQNLYNIELTIENSVGCQDDTDRNIFFGAPPKANFSSNDICVDTDIQFTNNSDNTGDVGSGDFKWRLSQFPFSQNTLIDTFINSGSFNYQFNSPGAYAMQLDLATSFGCIDDTIVRIDIRPVIDLSNGAVYNSNFNTDTIEWRPASLTDPNVTRTDFSWEQAIPNGTRINQGPNGPNENVWVTNATGRYINKEQSYVEGPCFDFSRVKRPMIIFDYFSDLAVNDGVVLQYSKNRGQTWRAVGLEETGLEWYNERSVAGNPGNQILDQVGWSITESGWKEARHQLDTLRNSPPMGSNNPFVRLRFAIGSSNNGQGIGLREGFAFSNLEIRERDKLTLIEHFTNINDANARQGDISHNELLNTRRNEYDILDIQYHTDFPGQDPINLDNSLEQGARSLFYGVSTIPRTVFEGNVFNNVTSTWVSNANILDDGKQKFVAQRILQDAKFDIDLNVTKTNSDLNGTVTFTAKENLIPGREYTAFIAVVEKFIPVSEFQNGSIQIPQGVEFRSVFKKFLPQASGSNISNLSNAGQSRLVNFNWNYNNTVYNPDSIYIVAFIQDNITREIYQVATDDTTNIWVPNSIDNSAVAKNQAEFKLYPNPSNGSSILQFYTPAEGLELMTVYDQMGHTIIEEEIIPGTRSVLLNLGEYPAGVYIVQIAHPKYGLKKSKLVITK